MYPSSMNSSRSLVNQLFGVDPVHSKKALGTPGSDSENGTACPLAGGSADGIVACMQMG